MNKVIGFVKKIVYNPITTCVLLCVSLGLLIYLLIGINPIERTISMAGYTKRIAFFFWVLSLDLLFLFNISYANMKTGLNLKLVSILLPIGFVLFLFTGIHDWVDVGKSVKGILLHAVPAILFAAIMFFCLFWIFFNYWKKNKSKWVMALWIGILCVFPFMAAAMILFQTSAIPEMVPFISFLFILLVFNLQLFKSKDKSQIDIDNNC